MSEPRGHIHSSFAHQLYRTQRTPNARSCHCNHLYLDYNSRPSKLVSTRVTLASFIQPRAVVCSYRVLVSFYGK